MLWKKKCSFSCTERKLNEQTELNIWFDLDSVPRHRKHLQTERNQNIKKGLKNIFFHTFLYQSS